MTKRRPGKTIDAVENEMISLAMDETRRRIKDGSASSQLLVHFVKEGTVRAQLEKERLTHEVELVKARTEGLKSAARVEDLMTKALKAMKTYSGHDDE